MPDRLMRVSASMRATSWSPWFRFSGTLTGMLPVSPGANICENTTVPVIPGGPCVTVKRTSSIGVARALVGFPVDLPREADLGEQLAHAVGAGRGAHGGKRRRPFVETLRQP